MRKRTDNKGRKLKEGESQRKDGMYQFRYTDSEGNRKILYSWKLTTQDKVPVGKRDGKCLRELELEITEENRKVTFAEKTISQCVKEYLVIRTDYANNTQMNYEIDLHTYIEPSSFGNILITKITKEDVLEFYSYLSKERKLGFSAIKRNHSLLNSVFKIAIKENIITKNPCVGCLRGYQTKTSKRTALTVQEQHALLEFLKDSSNYYSKYYDIVAILLGTGLRVSELIGLTWDEIDLEGQYINLKQQLVYDVKDGRKIFSISSPKNGTPRIIPLPSALVKIFQRRLEKGIRKEKLVVDGVSGFIFLNRSNKLYRREDLYIILHRIIAQFNKLSNNIRLINISAHTFRHTYCTRIIELGVDLKVVQEIMGHSTAKITLDIYTHLSKEQIGFEIHRVGEIDLGE